MADVISTARIGAAEIGRGCPLAVIAGPCVIESRDHTLWIAERIATVCRGLGIPLVFKASFDKANRTSVASFRGVGMETGLAILSEVARDVGVPVLTDIHLPSQADPVGEVVDCVQLPAFLCRQTDLVLAAGRTGKCVNVKKGQFMAPDQMARAVEKIVSVGNHNVLLTDRGTFFGYNRLVNDFTCIPVMQALAPVVFDATHSCQHPGAAGEQSGGQREFVEPLTLAATAAGADALFIEVHDSPAQAKSDSATQLPLEMLEGLLARCLRVRAALR